MPDNHEETSIDTLLNNTIGRYVTGFEVNSATIRPTYQHINTEERTMPEHETCIRCEQYLHYEDLRRAFHSCFENGSAIICHECYNKEFEICADCHKQYKKSSRALQPDYNGRMVCASCYEINNKICSVCGAKIPTYAGWEGLNNEIMCQGCFNERYTTCNDCGIVMLHEEESLYRGYGYCSSCMQENFMTCEGCDTLIHRNSIYRTNNGTIYCADCYNDSPEIKYGIKDYSFKPLPEYKIHRKSERIRGNTYYMGIELEIENMGTSNTDDIAMELTDQHEDLIYCKYDSSINNGFEVVTHPMSWAYYRHNRNKICRILEFLVSNGMQSYYANTCGIHIHTSKSAFTTFHMYKYLHMFYNTGHYNFIKMISQRTDRSTRGDCQWGRSEEYYDKRNIQGKAKYKENVDDERYTAVNLENDQTAEIRIFRGTLNPESFMKNIEFTKSMYDFSKNYSLKDMTIPRYIDYVSNKRATYTNLDNFITRKWEGTVE